MPLRLVERLKEWTAPGGVLALSCSYQWGERHLRGSAPPRGNIADLFDGKWTLLAEAHEPFRFRACERYWRQFLSHVLVWQKAG
jgi:hypothetical protein